ncbi:hypothetical protein EF405_04530 [Cyclobacteriaceae bacterium YHN15]|nr:hypothetical protein EF405_04530 [Cyclobacteriaceae bacterium YHN15]
MIRHNLKMMLHNLHRNSQLTEDEKARIWEVLCIGSDFEGYIDPAADYATVMEFEKLEEDLIEILEGFIAEGYQAEFHIHQSPQTIAHNMMMDNVMRFLSRGFG